MMAWRKQARGEREFPGQQEGEVVKSSKEEPLDQTLAVVEESFRLGWGTWWPLRGQEEAREEERLSESHAVLKGHLRAPNLATCLHRGPSRELLRVCRSCEEAQKAS